MSADPIRVAVIGAGGMGRCHAQNIAASAGAAVAWVADPDVSAGLSLASAVGAAHTVDPAAAIGDVDAVVVASPDRFHSSHVRLVFDAGLPIFCEKPLTDQLVDAKAIVDGEAALGRRLIQLGFMRVYDPRHRQVEAALADAGEVHHIRCVHRNPYRVERSLETILVESMIHDIHTVRWLSGSSISQVSTDVVERGAGIRFVLLTLGLANGGVATIEFDEAAVGYEVSVEVAAERANVVASEPVRAVVRRSGLMSSALGDDWFAPFVEAYRLEMTVWLESVRAGGATGPSAWDGFVAQCVVDAAVTAAESGAPVTVEVPATPSIYDSEESREEPDERE